METIAESYFDEQGTMVYHIRCLFNIIICCHRLVYFIFTHGNTINSCCVQKAIIFICEYIFSLKKTFLKKNGMILIILTDLDSDWLRTDDDHGTKGGIASPIVKITKNTTIFVILAISSVFLTYP